MRRASLRLEQTSRGSTASSLQVRNCGHFWSPKQVRRGQAWHLRPRSGRNRRSSGRREWTFAKLLRRTESVGCLHLCLVWRQAPGVGVPDGPPVGCAPFWSTCHCPRGLLTLAAAQGPPGPACAQWGCTASPPARHTALMTPVSSPPHPLGSSPLPPHGPHPAYTPR